MAALHGKIQVCALLTLLSSSSSSSPSSPSSSARVWIRRPGLTMLSRARAQSCDGVLERMEEMLGQFQSDLGNISGEIQSLQDQVRRAN
jgi:hypothetical protein